MHGTCRRTRQTVFYAAPSVTCNPTKTQYRVHGTTVHTTYLLAVWLCNATCLHEEPNAHDLERQRQVDYQSEAVVILPQNPAGQDTHHQRVQHGAHDQDLVSAATRSWVRAKNNRTIEGKNGTGTGKDGGWWGVRPRTASTCRPVKPGIRKTTARFPHPLGTGIPPFVKRQHACVPGPLQVRPTQAACHGEDRDGSATHCR